MPADCRTLKSGSVRRIDGELPHDVRVPLEQIVQTVIVPASVMSRVFQCAAACCTLGRLSRNHAQFSVEAAGILMHRSLNMLHFGTTHVTESSRMRTVSLMPHESQGNMKTRACALNANDAHSCRVCGLC